MDPTQAKLMGDAIKVIAIKGDTVYVEDAEGRVFGMPDMDEAEILKLRAQGVPYTAYNNRRERRDAVRRQISKERGKKAKKHKKAPASNTESMSAIGYQMAADVLAASTPAPKVNREKLSLAARAVHDEKERKAFTPLEAAPTFTEEALRKAYDNIQPRPISLGTQKFHEMVAALSPEDRATLHRMATVQDVVRDTFTASTMLTNEELRHYQEAMRGVLSDLPREWQDEVLGIRAVASDANRAPEGFPPGELVPVPRVYLKGPQAARVPTPVELWKTEEVPAVLDDAQVNPAALAGVDWGSGRDASVVQCVDAEGRPSIEHVQAAVQDAAALFKKWVDIDTANSVRDMQHAQVLGVPVEELGATLRASEAPSSIAETLAYEQRITEMLDQFKAQCDADARRFIDESCRAALGIPEESTTQVLVPETLSEPLRFVSYHMHFADDNKDPRDA